ncbi:hypothetical protein BJF92_13610 [Rhizobium rhizosphaerae]|uniref:Uncharacterized protein n=2 Tax=Xaviernesmea rhizosphaerae TaxID=1672749 RepID=A0A1Q9AI05_9HYPH|nr:hypothetical protein BJF92_13610 [Xaviernesmea rhizosphaerae]
MLFDAPPAGTLVIDNRGTEMSALDLHLLSMLIDQRPPTVRELPKAMRQKYTADGVERYRERIATSLENGVVEPTAAHVRQALADAAIHIVRTGGPGSEEVMRVLEAVFASHAGTPLTVKWRIKQGRIRPKFFKAS